MEYLAGVSLALAAAGGATLAGFDRDRAFYPTLLAVVASYYVLFAVMGASGATVRWEIALASVFLAVAVVGFRRAPWLTAAGLIGHGVFDLFHHLLVDNAGVPGWWPGFCLAFDAVAGLWLAGRLTMTRERSSRAGAEAGK